MWLTLWSPEVAMTRSSPQSPVRTALALTLLTTILLSFACAHQTAPRPAEPQAVPAQDTTGAADLNSNVIEKRPHESIAAMLQARTPGVDVQTNANGSISVRIRAASSFYANTEPLYVVDGTPFQPGPGGSLTGINPEDIESIQVLKYPHETALYGVRGANGVIVVTTKHR
jgi:TonB-dependent SusC/RagA subfamily outer membrane receptor